jgi:hypothetical protein
MGLSIVKRRIRETAKKLCECGQCGEFIEPYDKWGRELHYKKNHVPKGANSFAWKGGRTVHGDGYIYVYAPYHPHRNKHGQVLEHRIVMEEYVGRYLTSSEEVHHINGNKHDNRIENLRMLTTSDHAILHKRHTHIIRAKTNDWLLLKP